MGAQVTQLRTALGMSLPELARTLNVGAPTLSTWEKTGPHGLGLEVLTGLHRAVFDRDVTDLDRPTHVERIAAKLRLGLGATLAFGLIDLARGGSR